MTAFGSLFKLSLVIPGDNDAPGFDFLMDLESPEILACTADRLGPHETGDWQIVWLVTRPFTAAEWEKFIQDQAVIVSRPLLTFDFTTYLAVAVPETNWLRASYRGFPPQRIGRFFIRGSHDRQVSVPLDLIPMTIDAATAFGSGEHGTTRGCLGALCDLAATDVVVNQILDLGTGSGILAIAATKLWPNARVTAVDNDSEAVKVAQEYATLNDSLIDCQLADRPAGGPYDLVVANILAGPLKTLAPDIMAALRPGGWVILSGLLEDQQDEVVAAYTQHGATLISAQTDSDWAILVMQNAPIPPSPI